MEHTLKSKILVTILGFICLPGGQEAKKMKIISQKICQICITILFSPFQKVTDTNRIADTNYSNLQTQSQRLEAKTKSCNWWIWIMLILVTLTFLWMVVLMRMFPKS